MRLAFIADGRSSHPQRWLSYFIGGGHDVHLLTTYACRPKGYPGVTIHDIHLWARNPDNSQVKNELGNIQSSFFVEKGVKYIRSLRLDRFIRPVWERWIAIEAFRIGSLANKILQQIRPDLVHAFRIPIEGYVAMLAGYHPMVVSSWGCDFTDWGRKSFLHRRLTSRTLRTIDGFTSDCERDRRLAWQLGFSKSRPSAVCPGNGGVCLDAVSQCGQNTDIRLKWKIPYASNIVLYNRGTEGPYYRFETFVRAIPLILRKLPNTVFIVVGEGGNRKLSRLTREVMVNVRVLPYLEQSDMLQVFKAAQVMVSPTLHDGTPNSMLDAMACGCFPVMSDLDSIREWIRTGANGLLFDPNDPLQLSECVVRALLDDKLRQTASRINWELIQERAEYFNSMSKVESFYQQVLSG